MEQQTVELITKMVIQTLNRVEEKKNGFQVPVGVSARHIHLTKEHVEALFGEGYQLTRKKELMGGQFAANETVTVVGIKLRAIENVRVLGPVRKASQLEISATDAVKLGIAAPVRESGNVAGSAPIAVVGPKGVVYLKEGCIIACAISICRLQMRLRPDTGTAIWYPFGQKMNEVPCSTM